MVMNCRIQFLGAKQYEHCSVLQTVIPQGHVSAAPICSSRFSRDHAVGARASARFNVQVSTCARILPADPLHHSVSGFRQELSYEPAPFAHRSGLKPALRLHGHGFSGRGDHRTRCFYRVYQLPSRYTCETHRRFVVFLDFPLALTMTAAFKWHNRFPGSQRGCAINPRRESYASLS